MTRLSISRWSSLFFRFPSPISPQHSLGEADLWLAPHRGSEATGVVYQHPPTNSLGEADNHPLHPISPQKRKNQHEINAKISTKKSQKSARNNRKYQHEIIAKISTKKGRPMWSTLWQLFVKERFFYSAASSALGASTASAFGADLRLRRVLLAFFPAFSLSMFSL